MKRRMNWSLPVLLALLLLLAGGCGQEEAGAEEAEEGNETAAVAVEIQRVERGSIAAESGVSGQVAAGEQESVFVSLSAQCKDVYVEVGDDVTAGQPLFTVDISATLDNIQTTSMSLETARKSYQEQMALLSQQLQQANSQLAQAQSQLELAEKNLSDTQALLEIGAASQMEVDTAAMNVDNARMGVEGVQLSINNLLSSQRTAADQYELSAQNTQSTLNQLESSLKGVDRRGNVTAPISGTVLSLNAFKNGFTAPGTPMVVLESTAERKISAAVSESLVSKLHVGDPVGIRIEAAGAEFQGTISEIESSANPATHLYGVSLAIPPEQRGGLLSGMFADVTFYTDTQTNVVVIPTEAILTGVAGSYVYTLDSENIAHQVVVETGLVGDGITEITAGLSGGEALVTVGQFYLSDGALARVVPHQGG